MPLMQGLSSSAASPDATAADDVYNKGVGMLAQGLPAEALAAFSRAAMLGHAASHAAAAAIHFEGAVAFDGSVIDSDCVKAYDMCVRANSKMSKVPQMSACTLCSTSLLHR